MYQERSTGLVVMKDSNYQHMCTALMGIASLFRFIGHNISTFIIESLMHSAHLRNPGAIIEHAGYYGQAVKELSTCLSTLIVPIVLNFVSPKWALAIGSFMIALYFASFFFLSNFLYFIANILLGASTALMYTSFFCYQMLFSTRETLARNSTRILGIGNLSFITGGLIYMYITRTHASDTQDSNVAYRYYSENETRTMCILLFAFCLMNLALTCCLPTTKVENSVASDHFETDAVQQLKLTVATLIDPTILLLVPRFVNQSLLVSFFMNVYPTSLQYSTLIARPYPMITAYYSFAMCAGSTLCGLTVPPLNRYFEDFGLRPLYYIATGTQLIVYALAVLTVPNWSTARPTAESSLLAPHLLWVCLIAFLLGIADSANATSGVVLCSRILPHRSAHPYSAARFYREIAASQLIVSNHESARNYPCECFGKSFQILSLITFDCVVKDIEKRDQEKIRSTDNSSNEQTDVDI